MRSRNVRDEKSNLFDSLYSYQSLAVVCLEILLSVPVYIRYR